MARQEELLEKILDTLKEGKGNSSGYRQSSQPISTGFGVIDEASKRISGFSNTFNGILGNWETASREFGVNWNNDAIGLSTSIAKARMDFGEWSDSIKSAGGGFAGLGGTMNESAKIFTSVATGFRDSGASEALAKMAFSTGEQNKLLAMSMATQRHLDLSKVENQNLLFESVTKLGKEMDKTSQLYGIGRKEQIAAAEANKNDMKYQAGLNVHVNEQARAAMVSAVDTAPKAIGDLIKNFVGGGALTDENKKTAQAIGDLNEPLRNAVEKLKHASTKEEAAVYEKQIKAIEDEIAIRMRSREVQENIAAGTNNVAVKQAEIMGQTMNHMEGINQEAKTAHVSQTEAARLLREKAELAAEGKNARGEMYAGAQTTEGLVKTQRALDDAIKAPMEAAQALNEQVGKAAARPDKSGLSVNDRLSTIDKKTGEAMSDKIYGDFGKDLTKSINNGTFINDVGKLLEKGAIQGLSNIKSITAGTVQLMGNVSGLAPDGLNMNAPKEPTVKESGISSVGTEKSIEKTPELLSDIQKSLGGQQANIVEQMKNTVPLSASDLMSQIPQPVVEPINQTQNTQQEQTPGISESALKDINEQLSTLNTSMVKLISISSDMADATDKQYRATKQLSPNLNAR